MNRNIFCVFDFETSGRHSHLCEILQIGAIIIDNRTLKPRETFKTMVKPHDMDGLEDDALRINGITKEQLNELSDAYYPETIWPKFVSWVNQYNWSKGAPTSFKAPVPVGYNIIGYDLPIVRRYCKKYGPWDEKNDDQKLFNQFAVVDIKDIIWLWFEHSDILENLRLATVAKHLGLSDEELNEAHDALADCKICTKILCAYLGRLRDKLPQSQYMKDMCHDM